MADVDTTADGRGRHGPGVLTSALVGYVERVLGPEGLDDVFARAGFGVELVPRSGGAGWLPVGEPERLAEAAAAACGDPDIGRRTGEEVFRAQEAAGVDELFRAAGSVETGLFALLELASRTTAGGTFELLEAAEGVAVIGATSPRLHGWYCGIGAGYLASFPTWFGRTGACAEVQCQRRGDDRCVYRLTWSTGEVAGAGATRASSEQATEHFARLHAVAAELTSAEDVGSALRLVVERVGVAALAPRALLVTRGTGGAASHVYHSGFARPDEAERAAALLAAGVVPPAYGTPVTAELETGGRHYATLVALFPEGTVPHASERRAVDAYAAYATAAIETARQLEQARYDSDAATALLGLAGRLADAPGPDEVAGCLLDAVTAAAGPAGGRLWLCDDAGVAVDARGGQAISLSPADLDRLSTAPAPLVPGVRSSAMLRAVARLPGQTAPARLFPVVARGRLLAVVAAHAGTGGDPARAARAARVADRLAAIATQAAIALDNTQLVAAVRHQATHDPLTGMLNRQAFEDTVASALAGRRGHDRMATLLVDLDRFKSVNDALGHAAGDRLLREVAVRIQRSVRPDDVVARLGGDEFAVLLRGVATRADADRAARRLLDAMADPFELEGHELACSVSVGVAVAPDDGRTYDRLAGRAAEEVSVMKGGRRQTGPGRGNGRRRRGLLEARRTRLDQPGSGSSSSSRLPKGS